MISHDLVTINVADLPQTNGPAPDAAMIANVKMHGVIMPIVVTRWQDGPWKIVDGNRRLAALRACGLSNAHVPAVVVRDGEGDILTLSLNINRSDNFATQSHAVARMLLNDNDTAMIRGWTGMPTQTIEKHRRYWATLTHAPTLFDAFDQGRISASVMDSISRCTPEEQAHLATIMSGKGKLSAGDVKGVQDALRAPLPADTDTSTFAYPDATEITLGELTRSIHDLAERARNSGFTCSQLIDLVNTAPAFAPSLLEVPW